MLLSLILTPKEDTPINPLTDIKLSVFVLPVTNKSLKGVSLLIPTYRYLCLKKVDRCRIVTVYHHVRDCL